jgi:hypothetical protein
VVPAATTSTGAVIAQLVPTRATWESWTPDCAVCHATPHALSFTTATRGATTPVPDCRITSVIDWHAPASAGPASTPPSLGSTPHVPPSQSTPASTHAPLTHVESGLHGTPMHD